MRHFFLIIVLITSISSFSQVKEQYEFDSYYIKQSKFTGNQVVKMDYRSRFLNLGDGEYVIDVKLTSDEFMQTKVRYTRTLDFGGQTIYMYEGTGNLYLQPMNFVVESTVKLSALCKGNGYKKDHNTLISDYGVHILYWSTKVREPLLKSNFTIYPIKNEMIEIIEELDLNTLEQYIIDKDNFTVCRKKETVELNINHFDRDLGNYTTISHQTQYCKEDQKITVDFLEDEGVEGFYYLTFDNYSFEQVIQMIMRSYQFSFNLENKIEQKVVDNIDDKSYYMITQSNKESQRIVEVRSYYDGELEGDYIKVEELGNNIIQVHISYNGV